MGTPQSVWAKCPRKVAGYTCWWASSAEPNSRILFKEPCKLALPACQKGWAWLQLGQMSLFTLGIIWPITNRDYLIRDYFVREKLAAPMNYRTKRFYDLGRRSLLSPITTSLPASSTKLRTSAPSSTPGVNFINIYACNLWIYQNKLGTF